MKGKTRTAFRKKRLEHIASPEQLTDYLNVTNPGIWAILAVVILLLAGVFVWSVTGTLETRTDVKVVVSDHTAQIISLGSEPLAEGMPLLVGGQDCRILHAGSDPYGRSVGTAEVDLPDGTYDGTVVTEAVHPIRFLLESR